MIRGVAGCDQSIFYEGGEELVVRQGFGRNTFLRSQGL